MAETNAPDIVVLKFADSKIPEFKEVSNKDYVLCGEDNLWPEHLTYLYNKSAKHNAIINGKCNYILGGGFVKRDQKGVSFGKINRAGETLNDIMQKSIKDIEIYGGFRWIIIWDVMGNISDIFHDDFYKFRTGKEAGTFFYKQNWKNNRESAIPYFEFNENNKKGAQIFAYNEYRPGCDTYPLPGYVASNNYIETDIEISKFHLSAIRNGMMPSKLIQFFNGEPTNEAKGEIERKFQKKFAGSEQAGKFVLVFNPSKDKSIEISDLSASELDKQFDILNKTCQQEIFTGHQVVSPMLFGIKTEGQLGGTSELKTAYEIFINTYAKPKQYNLEKIVNHFGAIMGKGSDYYIEQVDPIGLHIDIASIIDRLPNQFIFEKLNIPKEYWPAATTIVNNPANPQEELETNTVNDSVKNLTAKQHQQLLRIIRQYDKGQITESAAKVLLKTGLGLSDEDIKSLLGIESEQAFSAIDEDEIIQMFSECGELKEGYHIVKTKVVKFSSDEEALEDEMGFFQQAFADTKVSDADILDLISKDKRISPETIAEIIDTTPEDVIKRISALIKKGLIESKTVKVGQDTEIERKLTKPLKDIIKTVGEPDNTEIHIKYSYEGPEDSRNRPFCAKMMKLNRLYSRFEIEQISQRLGYSVFDRRGGFWRKPDGTISASCRHTFKSNIVVKKGDK